MPRPTAAALALVVLTPVATGSLASCGTDSGTSGTTLQPLVTAGAAVETTIAPTTTVFVSDPASPVLSVLPPEAGCALAPPEVGGEITFVVGDRLFGVRADGTGARCLAQLPPPVRGVVQWSPDASRAVVGSSNLLDAAGTRPTGFNPTNTRVQWEHPGTGLIGPTDTNNTLVRREAGAVEKRSEVTFLAQTIFAVSHPSGQALIGAGIDPNGTRGAFIADPAGRNRRPLLLTADNTVIPEITVDAEGDDLYLVAETGGASRVHRLHLPDLSLVELTTETTPAARIVTGPSGGTVAWRTGLCNSITELRVRDDRSGTTQPVGEATPLQELSLAPVGWLDAAQLVLTARPIGCDGPADVWIWNVFDGSATLITKNVEFPAVRAVAPGGALLAVSPEAPPAQL
jgi:hypothetical protein